MPEWFVAACSPERTAEKTSWTLADWLYWMEPDERQWFWWDARIDGEGATTVLVEVPRWPSATGALEWLLRAAGASSVKVVDAE